MMEKVERVAPKLAEIVRHLAKAYEPERIYLFGSHARGDAGPDSDYDLMLIVPDTAPPERRRSRLAYQVLWETGMAGDILVWTREYFDSRLHIKASLSATVAREGKLLYGDWRTLFSMLNRLLRKRLKDSLRGMTGLSVRLMTSLKSGDPVLRSMLRSKRRSVKQLR